MKLSVTEYKQQKFAAAVVFVAVGIGYLFPFSALTQPIDYWHLLFPDYEMCFAITACYMWTNLLALGLLIVFGGSSPSYLHRIVGGFAGQFICLFVVPTAYFLHLSESDNYFVVMCCTSFAAVVSALIDSCAISLSAQYPVMCQEALQLGIGISTLTGSVYRILTKALFPPSMVVTSSLLYFYTGAATVALCIAAYIYLQTIPLTEICLSGDFDHSIDNIELTSAASEADTHGAERRAAAPSYGAVQDSSTAWEAGASGDGMETSGLLGSDGEGQQGGAIVLEHHVHPPVDRMSVLRRCFFNESMVFLLFSSTLCLWPPLITEIKSFNFPELNETSWWPLLLLFDFALLDVVGRLCVHYRGSITKDNIWVPVLLRIVVLFPLVICCVKQYIFTHDFFSVLFVGCLGFTNGYVGSLSVVLVNETVEEHEKGVAGIFTGFVLNSGLAFGSFIALDVKNLILGSA